MWDAPTNAAITAAFDEYTDRIREQPLLFPHAAAIWDSYQDDGYGNRIDTFECDRKYPKYTPYIMNFLGYDYISYHSYLCNYGEH